MFPTCAEFLGRHASAINSYDRNRSVYPCIIVAIMISSAPVWASSSSPAFTVDGEPTICDEKSSVTYCSWASNHSPGGPFSISSAERSGPGVPDKLRTVLTRAAWWWRSAISSVSAQITHTETIAYGFRSAGDGRKD